MAATRSLARRFGIGRLGYLLWHAPIGAVRGSHAAGGPFQQLADLRGRHAMERAAVNLPTTCADPQANLPTLHFLTGNSFWFQTAFCLHSLQRQAGTSFRAAFHDDGSLTPAQRERLQTLFPHATVLDRADHDDFIEQHLPRTKFPFLHDRRRRYPNIRKLTDVHAGRTGWQLVLDSDMLFFRRPEFVLRWLSAPDRPLHLVDVTDSYGYSRTLMESLAGSPIPPRVNVGLTGLNSDNLDWVQLEFWCRQLIETEGTNYYLEQALVAMLVAGKDTAIAPAPDYVIAPSRPECIQPTAVLHHYVAASKRWYFRETWRQHASPS